MRAFDKVLARPAVRAQAETDPLPATASHPSRWRSLGWLAGLPVLGLLWAASLQVGEPYLAEAIGSAARPVVRDSAENGSEPWLRVEVRGRDIVAAGEASDAARREAALTRLSAIPGLRRLIDRTGVVEDVSPFVWRATLAGSGRLDLDGSRPAGIGAAALATQLTPALPVGAIVSDHAKTARGAPPGFLAAAAYAIERLRGLKPGAVATLTDTVIALQGEAESPAAYEANRASLAAPPLGFSLGAIAILPPTVEDFRFGIARGSNGGFVLSGNVVSEAARAEIESAAAGLAAGSAVEDMMQTARGLPAAIDAAALARFAFRITALLHDGGITYRQGAVSVSGTAIDGQAVGEVEALMRDERPAGLSAGPVALTARPVSPYRVRIARDADTVTLSGHLPSAALRADLLALLKPRFFHETIVDRTRTAEGAPDRLDTVLKAAAPALATLARGEVTVSDNEVRVAGDSLYPESAKRLADALPAAMPTGWAVATAIGPQEAGERRDAATCARLFVERLSAHPLRFAPGSSELKPDFYPALDGLAALAKSCPGQRIEVVGHADPAGAPVPQAKPLPEYTASIGPKEKPKSAKAIKDAKAKSAKPGVKAQAAETPPSEPPVDLARQRALAIVEYLRQAGVAAEAVVAPEAPPLPEQHGVGLSLRS